jgi:hypothetical protein
MPLPTHSLALCPARRSVNSSTLSSRTKNRLAAMYRSVGPEIGHRGPHRVE